MKPSSIAERPKNGSAETLKSVLFSPGASVFAGRVNAEAREVIAALQLVPLPGEGGFVRQTWRGESGSAAYYLMTVTEFSALHRLRADEVWHFYAGDAVQHVTIDPKTGAVTVTRLGVNFAAGEQPQLVVPCGVWQGACLASVVAGPSTSLSAGWSLIGCTLTPAWEEKNLELGERAALLRDFPAASEWIRALTR
jgi:predicted cupin superfamily sugar epimerase